MTKAQLQDFLRKLERAKEITLSRLRTDSSLSLYDAFSITKLYLVCDMSFPGNHKYHRVPWDVWRWWLDSERTEMDVHTLFDASISHTKKLIEEAGE